ncbi:hypothetical protein DMA12_17250 [Amycolatopsis balhimycina DSM 5908]|uniref:Uncharacterized protein n=1 Tax=Amycolatopsis balhimycina DSM 5908 TaxID=1081091 RepID=A0A428WLM5_AMYBA|nr:hypothetical protein [Amycolatopsis balhimycina]RSM43968.1 hypothetical protein DMA12_17250 [Amycolatopsis balhimycina DSM 5908]
MDSYTGGALAWLAQGAASNLLERLVDRALDGPPQLPAWPRPGRTPAGTAEISVRQHLTTKVRTPVILTLQEAGGRTGTVFSVMLGHTTRVALPGGDYFGAAMVVDPLRRRGPTLQGIGWARLTVAAHRTSPVVIPAQRPTAPVLLGLGLRKPDGTPLFRL